MKNSSKLRSNFWSAAKFFDIFGRRISLTIKGEPKIKTSVGTIFSLLFMIGMMIKILFDFRTVWEGRV
jgi:hypothetical protein